MQIIQKAVSHLTIVVAGMFLVFDALNKDHPAMRFLDNGISETLLYFLAASALAHAVANLVRIRKQERSMHRNAQIFTYHPQ